MSEDPRATPAALGQRLVTFVEDQLAAACSTHLAHWRIPRSFGGRRVEADVAADLAFTLGHLHRAGVTEVAGTDLVDALGRVLDQVDGAHTHTFFSYRVAETLGRFGPLGENALFVDMAPAQQANLVRACDSTDWISLLDLGLPRNYAAVLTRCEVARQRLEIEVDLEILHDLLARLQSLLGQNPLGYLDDSTHGVGRTDIYTADLWLFTEPMAGLLGAPWRAGLDRALELVATVADERGTSIGWGRSTGVLSTALSIELCALAVELDHHDASAWLRRGHDATETLGGWFSSGVTTAHQHRSPYDYRGPFRRLQLTFDLLGKLADAGARLLEVSATTEAASHAATYPDHDRLLCFEEHRPVAVWSYRHGASSFVVPFVGATKSDYLAAPRRRGTYEVPVDSDLACFVPTISTAQHRWAPSGVPTSVTHHHGGVTATYDGLCLLGELDPALDAPRLPGTATVAYRTEGRTLHLEVTVSLEDTPLSAAIVIPETPTQPLHVEVTASSGGVLRSVDTSGIKEWRSFWGTLDHVHELDLTPSPSIYAEVTVTPKLRVSSSSKGHHYDDGIYQHLAAQVHEVGLAVGPLRDPSVALSSIDLFHLHWPEWLAFDDLELHRAAIAELAATQVPIVWTAHNLTPHDRRPTTYDPIYAAWAAAADLVLHHSEVGRKRMVDRYAFSAQCRHLVVPHGHFGDRYRYGPNDRATCEANLGLEPTELRLVVVGAPRPEKRTEVFLEGVARSTRADLQVCCWSLEHDAKVPEDPRIVVAEPYAMVDVDTYAQRLACADLVVLPIDPGGEMLCSGVVADVVGMGLGALCSPWPFLAEHLGAAAITCELTPDAIAHRLDHLDADAVAAAKAAARSLQPSTSFAAVAATHLAAFLELVDGP